MRNREQAFDNEQKEKGKNVQIVLKFMRHGERDLDGNLTDYGRDVTRIRAQESGMVKEDFDAVKAIGSTAGPKSESGMQRSLESAHLYAQEIAGDEAFKTRAQEILSYEKLINKVPFDYTAIYKSNLPNNFDQLTDKEKSLAAKKAQKVVANYLINLQTPEAEQYKREVAGSFAYLIEHYKRMAGRLNADSKVLIPAGSHGGMLEYVLEKALVREDESGEKKIGFTDLDEIGGEFDPSEAFNVDISTEENGDLNPLNVSFDSPSRPKGKMYLDSEKITELAEFYKQLHKESREDR